MSDRVFVIEIQGQWLMLTAEEYELYLIYGR